MIIPYVSKNIYNKKLIIISLKSQYLILLILQKLFL